MFLSFHTFANCMLDCLHLNQKKNYWYAFNWVYLLEFIAAELNRILWLSLIWCRALNAWVTRAPRRLNWSLNMRLLQISSSRDRLVVRTLRCGRSNRSSNLRHGSVDSLSRMGLFFPPFFTIFYSFLSIKWINLKFFLRKKFFSLKNSVQEWQIIDQLQYQQNVVLIW